MGIPKFNKKEMQIIKYLLEEDVENEGFLENNKIRTNYIILLKAKGFNKEKAIQKFKKEIEYDDFSKKEINQNIKRIIKSYENN